MGKFWNDKIKEIESYTLWEQPKDKKYSINDRTGAYNTEYKRRII